MSTKSTKVDLATDSNGFAVQVLGPVGNANGTAGATHSEIALPTGTNPGDIVRVYCEVDSYVEFGQTGVEAGTSSMIHPAGVEFYKVPPNAGYLGVERVGTADGKVSCTQMR